MHGCPVHCRVSTSISDLYSPAANSIPSSWDNQDCLQILSDDLCWGVRRGEWRNCPWLKTPVLEEGGANCPLASLMLVLSVQDVFCLPAEFHSPLYWQFLEVYIPISTSSGWYKKSIHIKREEWLRNQTSFFEASEFFYINSR